MHRPTPDPAPWDRALIEELARLRHQSYVAAQRSKGELASENPSLVAWGELPESLRRSNRSFAASVEAKLSLLGARLIPAGQGPSEPFRFSAAELEALAQLEHERWRGDLEADGWTRGGERDPAARVHPLLVDWELLPEAERDKDREAVRELPELLRQAGYAIARGDVQGER